MNQDNDNYTQLPNDCTDCNSPSCIAIKQRQTDLFVAYEIQNNERLQQTDLFVAYKIHNEELAKQQQIEADKKLAEELSKHI